MLFPTTPAEVRAATIKALTDLDHVNPPGTFEALLKARPEELKKTMDDHFGTDAFPAKLKELCSTTFINAASDSARVEIRIHAAAHPGWQVTKSDPKNAIRLWLSQI